MNKRYFVLLMALIISVVLQTTLVNAQMRRMSPEDQAKILRDSLNLNDAQMKKVTVILQDSREEMTTIMSENRDNREGMHSAMQDLRKKTDTKIKSILTEDQAKKYDAMQKARQERMSKRMQENK